MSYVGNTAAQAASVAGFGDGDLIKNRGIDWQT